MKYFFEYPIIIFFMKLKKIFLTVMLKFTNKKKYLSVSEYVYYFYYKIIAIYIIKFIMINKHKQSCYNFYTNAKFYMLYSFIYTSLCTVYIYIYKFIYIYYILHFTLQIIIINLKLI